MSSTNKTTHYELPQFVENDIFNPLVDDNDAYEKIDTALYNIADAEADDAAEIVGIKGRLDTAEGKVDALETQNGTEVLTTVAQTLSGAVNELKSGEDSLDGRLDVVEDAINNATTGLSVKVAALETQNGSETLDTTAQTLSGAVNELKEEADATDLFSSISERMNRKFESIRLCSIHTGGGQAIVKNGQHFVLSADLGSTFGLYVYDENYALLNDYEYEYDVHPNAMFMFNGKIYVVDSTHSDVYVINAGTYALEDVITTFRSLELFGGNSDENGNGYLFGNGTLYQIDASNEIIKTVVIETIPIQSWPNIAVLQGIFVFKGIVYQVFNRPNMLVGYTLEGECVGTIDVGAGNGFYPYGEMEAFCVVGDEVYMCAGPYSGDAENFGQYSQIFRTNIGVYVGNNSQFGQTFPSMVDTLIADASSTAVNPTGLTNDTAFSSAYEASCVYNYLYHIYGHIAAICFNSDFSDEIISFTNVIVANQLGATKPKFKKIFLKGCSAILRSVRCDNIRLFGANVELSDFRVDADFYAHSSNIKCDGVIFGGTSITMYLSKLEGDYIVRGTPTITQAVNEFPYRFKRATTGISTNADMPLDVFDKAALVNGQFTEMVIRYYYSQNDNIDELLVRINPTAKNALKNGDTLTYRYTKLFWDGTGIVVVPFTITVTANGINIARGTMVYADGTAYAGNTGLGLIDYTSKEIMYEA